LVFQDHPNPIRPGSPLLTRNPRTSLNWRDVQQQVEPTIAPPAAAVAAAVGKFGLYDTIMVVVDETANQLTRDLISEFVSLTGKKAPVGCGHFGYVKAGLDLHVAGRPAIFCRRRSSPSCWASGFRIVP
jgi:hypothetical protein